MIKDIMDLVRHYQSKSLVIISGRWWWRAEVGSRSVIIWVSSFSMSLLTPSAISPINFANISPEILINILVVVVVKEEGNFSVQSPPTHLLRHPFFSSYFCTTVCLGVRFHPCLRRFFLELSYLVGSRGRHKTATSHYIQNPYHFHCSYYSEIYCVECCNMSSNRSFFSTTFAQEGSGKNSLADIFSRILSNAVPSYLIMVVFMFYVTESWLQLALIY